MTYFVLCRPNIDFSGSFMNNKREPNFFSTQVVQAKRFYSQTATSKNMRLNVICGGCEHTAENYCVNRETFPYYCIEFVAEGKGTVRLADHTFELSPGTVFSYGPGIPQHILSASQARMIKYFVDFTGNDAGQALQKYVTPPGGVIRTSRPDELRRIWDDLIKHGLASSRFRSNLCSTLLEYLMLTIAETAATEKARINQAFVNYQRCRQYIRDHFMTLNSLEAIAETCSNNPAYLCRLFKKYDTQSPYRYLCQLKMAYAAERLQNPESLVKEIAYELGFDDPSHFTRLFTKIFGVSPQAFKKLR